jgi:hypothetical protein
MLQMRGTILVPLRGTLRGIMTEDTETLLPKLILKKVTVNLQLRVTGCGDDDDGDCDKDGDDSGDVLNINTAHRP